MNDIILNAQQREATGRRVKPLRRSGYVPAVVYGHHSAPMSLQLSDRELRPVLREAGANRLITLSIEGTSEPKRVLLREVQRDSISHLLIHVDFYEVIMTEKITAEIPIILVGESPVIKAGDCFLFQGLDSVEIECFPGDLPPEIQVNLAELTEIEQAILVRDLQLGEAVEILTDLDEVIVKVMPQEAEEVEAAPAAVAEVEVVAKKDKVPDEDES